MDDQIWSSNKSLKKTIDFHPFLGKLESWTISNFDKN
jgi:hypothetical protein